MADHVLQGKGRWCSLFSSTHAGFTEDSYLFVVKLCWITSGLQEKAQVGSYSLSSAYQLLERKGRKAKLSLMEVIPEEHCRWLLCDISQWSLKKHSNSLL